jgi:hypothetical protein
MSTRMRAPSGTVQPARRAIKPVSGGCGVVERHFERLADEFALRDAPFGLPPPAAKRQRLGNGLAREELHKRARDHQVLLDLPDEPTEA